MKFALAGLIVCSMAPEAGAHVPVFSDGSAKGPESAVEVVDVSISRVVYHEVTDGSGQLWITFEGQAGQEIPFRLGVPLIERLRTYRPALAVLGPDLPPVEVPFNAPEEPGGVILQAPTEADLDVFHEHFTGTESWIVGDLDLTLPSDGRYYAVAYVPSGEPGKLWVAMGDREVFGGDDIFGLPATINRVRAFHEVPQSPIPCFVPLLGGLAVLATLVSLQHRRRGGSGSGGGPHPSG